MACSIQNKLIFPGTASQGQPESRVEPSPTYDLLSLKTRSGTPVTAIYGRGLSGDGRAALVSGDAPTIIYFYGNAMCVADCLAEFDAFRKMGCNVVIPDYVGYGMSGGSVSESMLYQTADAAYQAAIERGDPKKVIVIGWSLGGSVAVDLASRKPVAGLVTLSTFTSMSDMARRVLPWLPTSLLLRTRLDNQSKIGQINCPILLIHGEHDSIVPVEMRDRLLETAQKRGRDIATVTINSGHNDIFDAGGDAMNDTIADFIRRCIADQVR